MTEWHTISAKFTSDEKKVLDILRTTYGLNHNQSLRAGLEMLARLISVVEYFTLADSRILRKVIKTSRKAMKRLDKDIIKSLEEFPEEQREKDIQKILSDRSTIFSHFDNIFDKKRKRGKKTEKLSRGRPKTRH